VTECDEMTAGDITTALPWSYDAADTHRSDLFIYDADGMGGPVIKVDIDRRSAGRFKMVAYYGSGEVRDKELPSIPGDNQSKKNGDRYLNFKAQSWTWARERFRRTYEAVERANNGQLINVSPDQLISISSNCLKARELQSELSRPRRMRTDNGKIKVESKREMKSRGVLSPNLAESMVMAFAESEIPDPNQVKSFEPDFEV